MLLPTLIAIVAGKKSTDIHRSPRPLATNTRRRMYAGPRPGMELPRCGSSSQSDQLPVRGGDGRRMAADLTGGSSYTTASRFHT
jgi:hypothetical protein